jgi:hypothetical protein
MRADWSRNELRRNDEHAWRFLENEATASSRRCSRALRLPQFPSKPDSCCPTVLLDGILSVLFGNRIEVPSTEHVSDTPEHLPGRSQRLDDMHVCGC